MNPKHPPGPPMDLANMHEQGIRPVLEKIRHHLNVAFSSAVSAHEQAATRGEKQSWRKS